MATSNGVYNGATNMTSTSSKSANNRSGEARCAVCQQTNCDVQIVSCGCLLHTTCLPLDVLIAKQQTRTNYLSHQTCCPCCHRSPIIQIRVLPLPMTILEEAARLREKDNEILSIHKNEATSLACGSPSKSIALFNGTNKRPFASKPSAGRSYRTGRWASEESAYTDKLIKSFDAGLLPLPHGIKLNDFLCELLSCRTSRLTKKLKNAKLSARTYRSWASGNVLTVDGGGMSSSNFVGGDIQRAQTLFLKNITPEWVRIELQFNISRMWRTHLANFCLQISYLNLNTKEWFSSLDAVDHIAVSCNDTKLQARRKRMRSAMMEDANAAARTTHPPAKDAGSIGNEAMTNNVSCSSSDTEGVFVGGFPFQRLSSMNLKSMAQETTGAEGETFHHYRDRVDSSLSGSLPKEASPMLTSLRKYSLESSVLENSMKHSTSLSSFVELFTPDMRSSQPPPSRITSSIDTNAPSMDAIEEGKNEEFEIPPPRERAGSVVDILIDEAIDSAFDSSNSETEYQGMFLRKISKFLAESDSPFQHVDIWVPMDISHSDTVGTKHIGGSSTIATTSSCNVTGRIYGGGQQESSLRLSHAGYTTIRASSQITNRLNEFGVYSKNFSFSPGFGLPGRVYLSRIPSWENNLTALSPDQCARVGGAKIYGVNTSLCLPIFTPVGTMVVGLYSTQNLARDMMWEKTCMEYFWKLKPEPKWKLTIDVGYKPVMDASTDELSSRAPSSPSKSSTSRNQAIIIPPSPKRSSSSAQLKLHQSSNPTPSLPTENRKPSAAPSTIPSCWNEQSLALLLGKYMPIGQDSSNLANNQDVAGNLMSLRFLLLRRSSCRTNAESKTVETIMGKYHCYLRANKQEHDIILSIANDWKQLTMLSPHSNAAQSSNYRSQSVSFNAGILGNSTMQSSSQNSFVPSARTLGSQHETAISSMNKFGDDFSLPLASFGSSLQNTTNVSSSMSRVDRPGQLYKEQNNVPRVVSEQGPIEQGADTYH
eukprot:CAMPEP_0201653970 /NCGR_PEP_ID=MMETSP0493-20130528/45257_1 /ASSEMBLY_ACC=CAM_ASM_000838 /TAXON_ID=420259 /ORGANISM="Thalassiosira gravida, Strain GMp14c1" /LENGTH=990 /DNA_ID=CAMNT_0048130519 /DNA_START=283 /DNA_END=3255 /DNA_ORIENTATION=-